MTQSRIPFRVEFAPGCFDDFEGTQEELDAMVAEIKAMFENCTLEELCDQNLVVELDELPFDAKHRPTLQ